MLVLGKVSQCRTEIKRKLKWSFVWALVVFCVVSNVMANEAEKKSDQDIERIGVYGVNPDVALRAFNSGNYELAEAKFKENVACALKAELKERSFLENSLNQQVTSEMLTGAMSNSVSTQPNRPNVTPNPNPTAHVEFSPSSGFDKPRDETGVLENTCENRGFQVYMVGMSQLQLGKAEEAEKNFEQAIKIDKYLYDAQHRLALFKLLREDKEGASEHLADIESALKRCHKCDFREKIEYRIKFLKYALEGKIKLK